MGNALTYSALDCCGFQINRLSCDGTVLNGPKDVVLSCGLVDLTTTPVPGDDRSSTDSNGSGGYCAKRTIDAQIESYDVKLTLCSVTDGELMELLGIYDPILDPTTGKTIGVGAKSQAATCYCAPAANGCANPGVAITTWHIAWCGEEQRADLPFVVRHYPRIKFKPSTLEVTRSNAFNTYSLTGSSTKNPKWGRGPGDIYPPLAGIENKEWAEHLTTVPFPGGCNCGICDAVGGYVVPPVTPPTPPAPVTAADGSWAVDANGAWSLTGALADAVAAWANDAAGSASVVLTDAAGGTVTINRADLTAGSVTASAGSLSFSARLGSATYAPAGTKSSTTAPYTVQK